jgi:hypothetical protein
MSNQNFGKVCLSAVGIYLLAAASVPTQGFVKHSPMAGAATTSSFARISPYDNPNLYPSIPWQFSPDNPRNCIVGGS